MQYDVNTPEEYLEVLEKDWRLEKLQKVRTLIQRITPTLREGIEYKMLSYADDKGTIFHLNAQNNYVRLYFGNLQKIDPTGELLQAFNLGKGCIRIKQSIDLETTRLGEFIERAVSLWQQGEDIAC